VDTISAAQFNPRYNISVAAHRIPVGVEWIEPQTMKNPNILKFMDKITGVSHPDYNNALENDPLSALSKVDVVARGKTFTVERKYRRGTVGTDARLTDEETAAKFRNNASRILSQKKIEKAVTAFMELDKIKNISELITLVTK